MSRTVALELEPDGLHIALVLDLAELPAVEELERLDANGDGSVPTAEQDRYVATRVTEIAQRWVVEVNDRRVVPRFVQGHVEVAPGQSGLSTLRILAELLATVDTPPTTVRVHFHDDAFAERAGLRDLRAADTAFARAEVLALPPSDGVRRIDDLRVDFVRVAPPAPPSRPSTPWTWRPVIAAAALLPPALAGGWGRASIVDVRVRLAVSVATLAVVAVAPGAALPVLAGATSITAVSAAPSVRRFVVAASAALAWGGFVGLSHHLGRGSGPPSDTLWLALRVVTAILVMIPLREGYAPHEILQALAWFRLPAILVDTAAATLRGVSILRDEATRLSRARQLRAPEATWTVRLGLYGTLASALFDRGFLRAERAHMAMAVRGFDGTWPAPVWRPLSVRGGVGALAWCAMLAVAWRGV